MPALENLLKLLLCWIRDGQKQFLSTGRRYLMPYGWQLAFKRKHTSTHWEVDKPTKPMRLWRRCSLQGTARVRTWNFSRCPSVCVCRFIGVVFDVLLDWVGDLSTDMKLGLEPLVREKKAEVANKFHRPTQCGKFYRSYAYTALA